MIRFLLNIALTRENLGFSSGDLLSNRSDFSLVLVVRSDLFVDVVLAVVVLFSETMKSD